MIKRFKWLYSQLLLGVLLLCGSSIHAQQTHLLLDPLGAGGFELGDTFESNGWTVINETQTNKWVLGAIPQWFAGNRGVYISNDTTTNVNAYTVTSASRVHFYRDITFPAGTESVTISLDASMAGEGNWDNILVYLADTNVVPSSVGPTSSTMSSYTANVTTIASQMTNPALSSNTLNPTWPNYTNGETGFFLDAVLGIESGSTSPQTQTNLNIQLTTEQVQYVSNNTKRLIITWKNDTSGGAQAPGSIDNIKVEAFVPLCYAIDNLVYTDLTDTSFTASWTADANGTGYNYEVRLSGEPGSGATGLISEGTLTGAVSTFSISNLSANTTYYVYVKKSCSTDLGSSNWRQSSVTTLCGVSGYFAENFDTTSTGTSTSQTVPACWLFIDSGVGSGYVSASADFSVPNGFYMTNGADTSNEYLLVSPQTENLGNGGARIRFRAKTTSTSTSPSTTLKVATLANQENLIGIVQVTEITLTTSFDEFVVNLPAGTNDYFAFMHGLNANSRVIYLDDIVYEPIPPCSSPTALELGNVGVNSVTVSFPMPTGLSTGAQFEYEIRTAGLPGSGTEGLFTSGFKPTTANTFTIDELDHTTNYTLYVRTNCGSGEVDTWRQVNFTTLCGVYTSINESFTTTATGSTTNSTVPLCWSFIDEGAGSGYVSTGSNFSGPNGFYITNSSDLTGNYVLVSPETNNLGNGNYRLRFRAKTTSSSGEELEILTLPGNGSTDSSTLITTLPLTTTYTEFIVYLPIGVHDYFGLKHGQSGTSRVIYIDDIVLEPIPSCVEINNFEGTINLNQLSATLVWENPNLVGLSNQFEVQYGLTGFELGTGTTQTVTGLNTIITGLTQGATYQFYVRRVCGDAGNSTWSLPVTLLMDYCTSIPTSNDGLGITQFVLGDQTFTIPDVMYQNLLDQVVNLDSQLPINSSITFGNNPTYHAHIWIDFNRDGVFDNDTERFFSGESLNVNPTTLDSSFTINDIYETGIYRMRIGTADYGQEIPNPCYSGTWGVTIDIKVNVTFPCLDPTDLEVSSVSTNSATLNWNAAGTNFEIEYGPQGFQQGAGTVISNVNKPYVLANLDEASDYSFYVRQICADGESGWSAISNFSTLCSTPSPSGDSFQTLVEDDLVSNIVVQGQSLKYYSDVDMTQEILAANVLTEGYYYITQTIGCESDLPLEVYVTLIERIDEPVVPITQEFCGSATLADLTVQGLPGAIVNWYADTASNQVLAPETLLSTGIYYVNQTDGVTTSHKVPVNVIINQTPIDLVATNLLVCGYSNYGSLQVGQLEGVTLKWYASLTAATPISNTQQVVTGTYYVTQSFGICESNRVEIQVAAFEGLPTPIAATQTFCGSARVSQLVAQGVAGAQLKWYGSATSNVELNPNAQLASGTYYVEQRNNGCISARKAVAVRVVSMTSPVVDAFTLCGSAKVSDLIIPSQSGITHKWFTSPSSTNELAQNVSLTTGVYFVSRVQYGCESQRTAVQITIAPIPTAPSGAAVQTFIEGSVVSDLVLNQSNVVWYASYTDSQNGINPLVANMPLVNGQTYYAVVISANGCPSLPFAVTVDVYLSNDKFDKEELKYFPNPVDDVLTISYNEIITQIEVFDLLGKRVNVIQANENEVKVDLSNLPSGTYLIQLKTDTKQQFIKIIKR